MIYFILKFESCSFRIVFKRISATENEIHQHLVKYFHYVAVICFYLLLYLLGEIMLNYMYLVIKYH